MKSVTFTISKGGVGKSLITANVAAALAKGGMKVVLIEGDPNRPLQVILGIDIPHKGLRLDDVVKKDADVQEAVHSTELENLFLIPSGISLQGFFDIDPVRFARKLLDVKADFMLVDVPFPLGKAAILSLGICDYFIPILTEDEFTLCVESAIDTVRLGEHYLNCIPIGFVLNRIKNPKRFDENFVNDLEKLLEFPCITKLLEDHLISASYGGAGTSKAFLAYDRYPESDFRRNIDEIATKLRGDLPKPREKDVLRLIREVTKF